MREEGALNVLKEERNEAVDEEEGDRDGLVDGYVPVVLMAGSWENGLAKRGRGVVCEGRVLIGYEVICILVFACSEVLRVQRSWNLVLRELRYLAVVAVKRCSTGKAASQVLPEVTDSQQRMCVVKCRSVCRLCTAEISIEEAGRSFFKSLR